MPRNRAPHSQGQSTCVHPGYWSNSWSWLNEPKAKGHICILETHLQVAPTGPAFSQCTACSQPVLEALDQQGWELVKKVGEKPNHLEDLTGLTALMQVKCLWSATVCQ